MPELPDLEVFKQYFDATALHQKIKHVEIREPDMLGEVSESTLRRHLEGQEFTGTHRHGKYLFAALPEERWLVLHFGMTGFLKYGKDEAEMPSHTRLTVYFTNGYFLAYDCQRKLGLIDLSADPEKFKKSKSLGVDPFSEALDFGKFKNLYSGRRGSVKSALMNQEIMAGLGNIYSDEILFHSDLHPAAKVANLKEQHFKTLYQQMQQVLHTAIESRADPAKFPRSYLLPNREDGKDCPKCSGKIKKEKVVGRSAYFCNKHQKKV